MLMDQQGLKENSIKPWRLNRPCLVSRKDQDMMRVYQRLGAKQLISLMTSTIPEM